MNPNRALNERAALRGVVGFQQTVIFSLLGLTFAMACGWAWTVVNSTVVILPPEVKRPYEIGSNFGNKEYLGDMANYVLQTVLTVSAESTDFNNKVILKMTDPDGYAKLKTELEASSIRLKRDRITTVWIPRKEEISERDHKVKVSGHLKTYISDVLTSDREKDYLVEFSITSSGRLYVTKIQEIVKPEPARVAAQ